MYPHLALYNFYPPSLPTIFAHARTTIVAIDIKFHAVDMPKSQGRIPKNLEFPTLYDPEDIVYCGRVSPAPMYRISS